MIILIILLVVLICSRGFRRIWLIIRLMWVFLSWFVSVLWLAGWMCWWWGWHLLISWLLFRWLRMRWTRLCEYSVSCSVQVSLTSSLQATSDVSNDYILTTNYPHWLLRKFFPLFQFFLPVTKTSSLEQGMNFQPMWSVDENSDLLYVNPFLPLLTLTLPPYLTYLTTTTTITIAPRLWNKLTPHL